MNKQLKMEKVKIVLNSLSRHVFNLDGYTWVSFKLNVFSKKY